MKHTILVRKALSFLLALVMVTSILPASVIMSFAGYEDGTECQYCGGYRFDDGSVSISDVTVPLNVIAGKTTL